jgi:glycosyltransferase involved in cell wall biosynthesis
MSIRKRRAASLRADRTPQKPHKMSTPRITALIDTYNQGRFIDEAIESVLSQDFPASDMEILVVDDGSTDDTRARVEKYGERVRYVWKPNGGQASALNLGFEQARGEIVAMLDGDDVWLPQKLRRVVEESEKHPEAGMICHPNLLWDIDTGKTFPEPNFFAVTDYLPDSVENVLRFGAVSTSGMAIRASIFRKALPIPERLRIFADTYLLGVVIFTAPIVAVKEYLTHYRIHGANLCSFRDPDAHRAMKRAQCSQMAAEDIRTWIEQRGLDISWPAVTAHVKRQELVAQMVGFICRTPGRREYFRYLREFQNLYSPLWTRRYRWFRAAMSVAGLTLGYRRFEALRDRYRQGSLSELRGKWFPVDVRGTKNAATGKHSAIAVP